MFKVVTECVDKPLLLMLCDGPCANTCTMPMEPGTEQSPAAHQEFVKQAAATGWLVRLDMQLCAAHHKQHLDSRSMVKVVPANFTLKN